jgi:TorA maturation chaperone TorD
MQDEKIIEPEVLEQLCDVLKGRSEFYLTLAGFYFKPLTQTQIDHMAGQDYSAYTTNETLLDEGFDDIRRVLRKRHTGTRSMLATEWTSTFGGAEAYKGRYCVPNASVFLDKSGLTYGWPRNKAYQLYDQQCLRLKENAGMPESHLSFELEFLSILSAEISAHLKAGELNEAIDKIDLSQLFIKEHILTWLPQLTDLATLMLKTRFYRGVLKITMGYLRLDLETLTDIKSEIPST